MNSRVNLEKSRCAWVSNDPLYLEYHDTEWGVPEYDERRLFEKLILDGAQAGLSWITILRKREGYRRAFDDFDPQKIARYDQEKIRQLLQDAGIVRNRLKINAAIQNAQAFLAVKEAGEDFSRLLWSFVGGKPHRNEWADLTQIPAKTEESERMSRTLLRRGFRFVGPTICYAFMQATGMVNDHTLNCFRRAESSGLD